MCLHAPIHTPTHARPGLPINQNPKLTPAEQYGLELHYTSAEHLNETMSKHQHFVAIKKEWTSKNAMTDIKYASKI